MERVPIGELLKAGGVVTDEQIASALRTQGTTGARFASQCLLLGFAEEVDLLKALSKQKGIPGLDLSRTVVPVEDLKIVPKRVAIESFVLPVRVEDDRIFLAMADPDRRDLIDEVQFVTGRPVVGYIALQRALKRAIAEAYELSETGGARFYKGSKLPPDTKLIETAQRLAGAPGVAPSVGIIPAAAPLPSPEPAPARAPAPLPSLAPPPESAMPVPVEPAPKPAFKQVATPVSDMPVPPEATLPGSSPDALIGESVDSSPVGIDGGSLDSIGDELSGVTQMPAPESKPGGSGRTIMVVDDDDDIRRLVATVLRKKGHEVMEAARGRQALDLVRQNPPDLIVLDAMLPEIHGFEICRKLKGSPRYRDIPIIMISAVYRGWRYARDLKESYKADGFIEKPFRVEDLNKEVARILEVSGKFDRDSLANAEEADRYYRQGVQNFVQGKSEEAKALFRQAIDADPFSAKLRYHLAAVYLKENSYYEAIQEFEQAVDLKPDFFNALKSLAMLYQRMGFRYKAIETWERAMACAPNDEIKGSIKDHIVSLFG